MNRTDNGRWLKGTSGNPRGRPPRERSITRALRERLDADVLAQKVIDLAMDGDTTAIRFIWERLEGKVPDFHEVNVPQKITFSIAHPSGHAVFSRPEGDQDAANA